MAGKLGVAARSLKNLKKTSCCYSPTHPVSRWKGGKVFLLHVSDFPCDILLGKWKVEGRGFFVFCMSPSFSPAASPQLGPTVGITLLCSYGIFLAKMGRVHGSVCGGWREDFGKGSTMKFCSKWGRAPAFWGTVLWDALCLGMELCIGPDWAKPVSAWPGLFMTRVGPKKGPMSLHGNQA